MTDNTTRRPMTKQQQAQKLRAKHLTYAEIAARLGVSLTTVYRWCNPEFAERKRAADRERKKRYRGQCVDCGKPTNGSNGPGKAPKRCRACTTRHRTFWTRETIIAAICEYHRRYGRQPASYDWNVAMARRMLAPERVAEVERRWEEALWPHANTVRARFGRWSAAIEAAGFTPLRPGDRIDPERWRRNLRAARAGKEGLG